jgi:hypothetical protein
MAPARAPRERLEVPRHSRERHRAHPLGESMGVTARVDHVEPLAH